MSSFIRDLHVQAMAVVSGLDAALLFMPVSGKEGYSPKLVQRVLDIRRDAQRMLNLTGEEGGLEQEYAQPDYKGMLGDLVGAVMLRGGRLDSPPTTDAVGVAHAMAALQEMGPLLGKLPDDRGDLLEAVRAQDATCTLHVFAAKAARFDVEPLEEHLNYPTPEGAAVVAGMVFLVPSPPPLRSMRRATVIEVIADGRCSIVRAKLEPHKAVRAVPAEAPNR